MITFVSNTARESGGAICSVQSLLRFSALPHHVGIPTSAAQQNCSYVLPILNSFVNNSSIYGGAFRLYRSYVEINGNSNFSRNTAATGGGINAGESEIHFHTALSSRGAINLSNSNLKFGGNANYLSNTAGVSGGAVNAIDSGVLFEAENNFANNSAFFGGALSVDKGNLSFSKESNFANNWATYGGGAISAEGSDLVLSGKNTFDSNVAQLTGPGGYGGGVHAVRTKITVIGLLNLRNNSARYGGGIAIAYHDPNAFLHFANTSVSFCGNYAQKHGGAMLIEDAQFAYCDFGIDSGPMRRTCFFKFVTTEANDPELVQRFPIICNKYLHR